MCFFENIGFHSHGVLNLTPGETFSCCGKGAILVDVRNSSLTNFKMFMMPGVLYLPLQDLVISFEDLPHDKPLIFADSVGLKSREAVLFLMEKGYENIANLAGGIVDWEADGFPVTIDKAYRLSGSCMCQLKPREGRKKSTD
jgi:rhodanese-related sulfurtransferase